MLPKSKGGEVEIAGNESQQMTLWSAVKSVTEFTESILGVHDKHSFVLFVLPGQGGASQEMLHLIDFWCMCITACTA